MDWSFKIAWGALLCVILFGVGVVLAAGKQKVSVGNASKLGYAQSNMEEYRASISSADSSTLTHANVVALATAECEGYQTLALHGRFSSASATVVTCVVRYDRAGTILGASEQTLTAKATFTDGNGDYFSNPYPVDTEGCAYVRVVCAAPSAGSVDLWLGAY